MNIASQKKNNILVINIEGEFDIEVTTDFKDHVYNLINDKDFKDILIDFRKITFLDSSGIGSLVKLGQRIQTDREGKIYVYGASDYIKGIIEITRLDNFFKIINDEEYNRLLSC